MTDTATGTPTVNAVLLLLLDSRSPAGGHNHSGGMEPAISTGLVQDLDDVEDFCRTRLRTTGRVSGAFAAAASRLWLETGAGAVDLVAGVSSSPPQRNKITDAQSDVVDLVAGASTSPPQRNKITDAQSDVVDLVAGASSSPPQRNTITDAQSDVVDLVAAASSSPPQRNKIAERWAELEAELDARTPSEAMRAASRQLGRGLSRLVRATLPDFVAPWAGTPHHPIVLGAAIAAAGGTPELAATAAALGTVAAPASAAVRLLGLDPFAVHGLLASLGAEIDAPTLAAPLAPARLPADSAPALDLLADFHLTAEVRLFAS